MLDRLIEAVRAGQSQTLLLRGEPGIGKTALPDHLGKQAAGFRVAPAASVQAEMAPFVRRGRRDHRPRNEEGCY